MIPEMKLVVTVNDKVLHTFTKEIRTDQFVNSLQNFQKDVNSLLTKMIEVTEADDNGMQEDEYYSNHSTDDEEHPASPKKTKKENDV